MNEGQLSDRLACVAAQVPVGARLADIGSDHAYLPVYLVKSGRIDFAISGEVRKGPFESAQRQIRKSGLEDKIYPRLADGLAAITAKDAIDTIVIAGMGGQLIVSILEKALENQQINGSECLILQPNLDEDQVRHFLYDHSYQISQEEIICDKHKIYEVIVAKRAELVCYGDKELFFGPCLLSKKSDVFLKKWQHQAKQKQKVIQQLKASNGAVEEKIATLEQELQWIEEVIS